VGMALARKLQNKPGNIYVMISDGECQEGTTWESLLIAARHKLDNLFIFVDYNKIQALSTLEEALPLDNLASKFKAFNWDTLEVTDGHSFDEILSALKKENTSLKPRVIIFNTVKGKGVKAFEDDPIWHARKIKGIEMEVGKKELGLT
jgi:transketolase